MKAVVQGFSNFQGGNDAIDLLYGFYDGAGGGILSSSQLSLVGITNTSDLCTAVENEIMANAVLRSYTIAVTDIVWAVPKPMAKLENAPQAAITNAPADAVTNYNVVTTLLGALTSAVNSANTKQNDIATKLNSVLAALRTLGIIIP